MSTFSFRAAAEKAVLVTAALATLVPSSHATWSIVVANSRTGEVGIASATCIPNNQLKPFIGLIQVGRGAAASQSTVDETYQNRIFIWSSMMNGARPAEILAGLEMLDSEHRRRQYGIVTMDADPVTFTGLLAGVAKYGVTGEVDDMRYAIQGNVLSGWGVVYGAEEALLSTDGDLGQKLMAAMQAAKARGGDGRCSCSAGNPTGCGPTPPSFTFSAYTSFIALARMGDVDGSCKPGFGCANGQYYLDLAAISNAAGPEPITLLQQRYDQWRTAIAGYADHLKSSVVPAATALRARASTQVDVYLADVDGLPITHVPDEIVVAPTGTSTGLAEIGSTVDFGGGHYAFFLTANETSGDGTWSVSARYPDRTVRIWPDLDVKIGRGL